MREQCYERKQSLQAWCGAQYRQVRPLPLRFYPQVRSRLFKRHFHLPAQHKPLDNLFSSHACVGTQQGLWFKLAIWVGAKHPPNAHRCHSCVIPPRRSTRQAHGLLCLPILTNADLRPQRCCINQTCRKSGVPRSFQAWSTILLRQARRCLIIQRSIKSQARDHGDGPPQVLASRQEVECGVRAIGSDNERAIGQRATYLLDHCRAQVKTGL